MSATVFLLSPASCSGRRADVLLNPAAAFPLAVRLREGTAPLGEVFSFLSGLYFRGKLTYARAFGVAPDGIAPALIITTNRGLLTPAEPVAAADVRAFGTEKIESAGERFSAPLRHAAAALDERAGPGARIVLLGSIATAKYTEVLLDVFADRLLFPVAFVGRGDMSRGGLLLRCADAGAELEYAPVRGAVRRGSRPPRLAPRRGAGG
jgi:hypothetical protein